MYYSNGRVHTHGLLVHQDPTLRYVYSVACSAYINHLPNIDKLNVGDACASRCMMGSSVGA